MAHLIEAYIYPSYSVSSQIKAGVIITEFSLHNLIFVDNEMLPKCRLEKAARPTG
jgi:hypothetical protein